MKHKSKKGHAGARPGIESIGKISKKPKPGSIGIEMIDIGDEVTRQLFDDVDAAFALERPTASRLRWININGLHPYVINACREVFGVHTLHAEDVLHVPQRPRVEEEANSYLFVITRMLMQRDDTLISEQVSLFLFGDMLLTIQETAGDVWEPIRERINTPGSRIRRHGAGFLAYALLDAIVDHNFPLLEHYGDRLEVLEDEILMAPDHERITKLHTIKRELLVCRRTVWPMREVVDSLRRHEGQLLSDETQRYLTDVHEHVIQIIDLLESYREMASSLTDLYMTSVSNRMNEIMKVLTIMAAFFIPITFVAGVYGMNFEHMPELAWKWAYPSFWLVVISITCGLFVTFKRRNWL